MSRSWLFLFIIYSFPLFALSSSGDFLDNQHSLEDKESKKWQVYFSHSLSTRASQSAKTVSAHSFGGSYNYSKDLSLSVGSSYVYPFGFVSDDSFYGFQDVSIQGSFPLKTINRFLPFSVRTSLGLVLPTAQSSWKKGQYFSLFGTFSYGKKVSSFLSLQVSHVFYSNFYKYRTDIVGSPNSLGSSSHSASVSFSKGSLRVAGSGSFYLYSYLSDTNPNPEIDTARITFRGSQAIALNASYMLLKRFSLKAYGTWSINVPVVSPVLTGFPFFDEKNWLYTAGLSWAI